MSFDAYGREHIDLPPNPVIEDLPLIAYVALLEKYSLCRRFAEVLMPDGTTKKGFFIDGLFPVTVFVCRGAGA